MAKPDIDRLQAQLAWIEDQIQQVFPWQSCPRCAEPENPEDATTHVDHFFDWARTR